MAKTTETIKKTCQCTHCGNEAEMMITCELPEHASAKEAPPARRKGHAVCTHCGAEADMWIDDV